MARLEGFQRGVQKLKKKNNCEKLHSKGSLKVGNDLMILKLLIKSLKKAT